MGAYISTYFITKSGDRYNAVVSLEGYSGEVTEVDGVDDHITLNVDSVKWVVDRIQGTRATLHLFLRDRHLLDPLYMAGVNAVTLRIERNGSVVWGGFLDQEAIEVPRNERTGYVVDVRFGDFKPLKAERYTTEGLISITEALQRTVARLGVAVKTDFAHLAGNPSEVYIDTELLGDDPTLYDLLDLVCNATVSTVRQWGVVSFRSPSRLIKKVSPIPIEKWYGDNGFVSVGQMYNTITYKLDGIKPTNRTGGVEGLTAEGRKLEVDGEVKGYYKVGTPSDLEHTYDLHTKEAFGFMKRGDNGYEYSTILLKEGDLKYAMHSKKNHSKWEVLEDIGTPFLSLTSKNLSPVAGDIHIKAKVGLFGDSIDMGTDKMSGKLRYCNFVMPAMVEIISPRDRVLYSYNSRTDRWEEGDRGITLLTWNGLGMTAGGELNLNGDKAEGLFLPLPQVLQSGCKLRVTLYDGYNVAGQLLSLFATPQDILIIIAAAGKEKPCQLHQLLYGLEIGQEVKQGSEEQGLEVKAFTDIRVSEGIEYDSKIGTHKNTPAWMYQQTENTSNGTSHVIRDEVKSISYKRIDSIGGDEHHHLVFKNMYPIYGERGSIASLRIKGTPDSDLYTYEGKTYIIDSTEVNLRGERTDLMLQEIKFDEYVGQKL